MAALTVLNQENPSRTENPTDIETKEPDELEELFGPTTPTPPLELSEASLPALRAQLTDIVFKLVDAASSLSSSTTPLSKEQQRANLETQRLDLLSQIRHLEEQEERDKMAGMKVDTSKNNSLGLVLPPSPKLRLVFTSTNEMVGHHKRKRRAELSNAEAARIRAEEEAMDLAGDTEILPSDIDDGDGDGGGMDKGKNKKRKKRKRELTEEEKEMERRGWYIDERFVEDEDGKWVLASEVLKKRKKEKRMLKKGGEKRQRKSAKSGRGGVEEANVKTADGDEQGDLTGVLLAGGDFELVVPGEDAEAGNNKEKTKDVKKNHGKAVPKPGGKARGKDTKDSSSGKGKSKSKSEMSLFERWAKELSAPFAGAAARFM